MFPHDAARLLTLPAGCMRGRHPLAVYRPMWAGGFSPPRPNDDAFAPRARMSAKLCRALQALDHEIGHQLIELDQEPVRPCKAGLVLQGDKIYDPSHGRALLHISDR